MTTECNLFSFDFQPLGSREVVARFDGGRITSDAGALLLRETERATGIIQHLWLPPRSVRAQARAPQTELGLGRPPCGHRTALHEGAGEKCGLVGRLARRTRLASRISGCLLGPLDQLDEGGNFWFGRGQKRLDLLVGIVLFEVCDDIEAPLPAIDDQAARSALGEHPTVAESDLMSEQTTTALQMIGRLIIDVRHCSLQKTKGLGIGVSEPAQSRRRSRLPSPQPQAFDS